MHRRTLEPIGQPLQTNAGYYPLAGRIVRFPLHRDGDVLRWVSEGAEGVAEMIGDRMASVLCDTEPGAIVPIHYQPYSQETIYLLAGELELHLQDVGRGVDWDSTCLGAGDDVVIPAGTPHSGVYKTESKVRIVFDPPVEVQVVNERT